MSEKTLVELICDLRRQLPGSSGYHSCAAMFDARLARAEAAERMAEVWDKDYISSAAWNEYVQALAAYKDACERIRKLEADAFEKTKEACKPLAGDGET